MATTVAFFHAHPDDEAIFTGGTVRRLTDERVPVVLVLATKGEGGDATSVETEDHLAERRVSETLEAAAVVGVDADAVRFLGYRDSGIDGLFSGDAFAVTELEAAAAALADLLQSLEVGALVVYDPHGIYGHADHVQVHRVGRLAAEQAGIATVYECTVDREYLHFVETHLVEQARQSMAMLFGSDDRMADPASRGLGLAGTEFGLPSVLIDLTIDVRPVLDAKRSAMLAHASQIPADSPAMRIEPAAFAEVYGYEWYTRTGPPGPLDALASTVP